jgi:thiol-disulfide isomerase/thioredoxin
MKSVLSAVLIVSCVAWPSAVSADVKPVEVRKVLPGFKLKDGNGATVRLSDFKGKVVLLNFWATWCAPCRAEMPWFIEWQDAYKPRGFEVVGISVDEKGWKAVKPFLAGDSMKVNYTILLDTQNLTTLYAVTEMPKTIMLDRNGKVAAIHYGLVDKATIEAEIKTLVAEPGS